jgi:uncharacterized heparinase superfamily protein
MITSSMIGGFIPELAEVCLAAVIAFDMPCAINMYITNAGQKTSAPPHTDKQVLLQLLKSIQTELFLGI